MSFALWHPHVHSIVPEGIFTENGHFVHIPDIWKHKADKIFAERVFAFLLAEHKINEETAGSMRSWKHSGFHCNHPGCSPTGAYGMLSAHPCASSQCR
jgi:hypothetical protein